MMDLAFKALRLVIMACGEFHCERREDLDIVVKIRVDRIHEVRILTKKNFHKKGEKHSLAGRFMSVFVTFLVC